MQTQRQVGRFFVHELDLQFSSTATASQEPPNNKTNEENEHDRLARKLAEVAMRVPSSSEGSDDESSLSPWSPALCK